MNASAGELLVAFELHSVERIRDVLSAGLDVQVPIRGKSPLQWLTEMYTRSDRFPDCVRLLLERGAVLEDPRVAPVLLNDADALAAAIQKNPLVLKHQTTMVSAFTPLVGASLLHVAAEYGHVEAARVLLEMGADADARAAVDEFGMNGHTPLFHAVNSNDNRSAPIMRMLLDAGARIDIRLHGITWGKGFEWETTCYDVTPVSFAQFGLLPQMHRREEDVYANIMQLLEVTGRVVDAPRNIPNQYLKRGPSG